MLQRNGQECVRDRVKRPAVAKQPVEGIANHLFIVMRKRSSLQLAVEIRSKIVDHALARSHPAIGQQHINEAAQPVNEKTSDGGYDNKQSRVRTLCSQ